MLSICPYKCTRLLEGYACVIIGHFYHLKFAYLSPGLASFSANVFKKYPIELTGLLQYVANQLTPALWLGRR